MTSTHTSNGSGTAAKAGEVAADLAGTARREAETLLAAGKAEALRAVDAGRASGADTVHGVADAARKAADDLEKTSPDLARLTRDAAAMADKVSDSIRGTSLGSLVQKVEGFARREPVAFFGAALATGFALTRFLGSSARHDSAQNDGSGRGGDEAPNWRTPADGMPSPAGRPPTGHAAAEDGAAVQLQSGPESARHIAGAAKVANPSSPAKPSAHSTVGSAVHAAAAKPAQPSATQPSTGLSSVTRGTPSSPPSAFSSAGSTKATAPDGPSSPVRPEPAADKPQGSTHSDEAGKAIGGPSGPDTATR